VVVKLFRSEARTLDVCRREFRLAYNVWILRVQSAQPDLRNLPADLAGLVRSALARNPGDRPTAASLAAQR
jgi:hypothetical protein